VKSRAIHADMEAATSAAAEPIAAGVAAALGIDAKAATEAMAQAHEANVERAYQAWLDGGVDGS
jgi:hypothetical protein